MKKYEKPQISYVNVKSKDGIADTCWGLQPGHAHDVEYFYDIPGTGYVGFHVKGDGKNCGAPDAYNVLYYEYAGETGDATKGAMYEKLVEEKLTEKGGNNGQPYKGISVDFPTKPDTTWS